MKEQLIALLATTAITNGAIIATYDSPELQGAKFTVTFEDESIIQAPSGNIVGHAGLLVTIKAEGNPNIHAKAHTYIFDTYGELRKGYKWDSEGDFAWMGERGSDNPLNFNVVEFWKNSTEDRLVFNAGDEMTLFYPQLKESNVLTQMGAMYLKYAPANDTFSYNTVLPSSVDTVPEPSAALLTVLAALGTLRRKRSK